MDTEPMSTIAVEYWQERADDINIALSAVRDERDALRKEVGELKDEVKRYRSMVDRVMIAMSQGAEL
jgi:uncharacterized coiled-coil DUF342 family protein